jgi:hypothetical protein
LVSEVERLAKQLAVRRLQTHRAAEWVSPGLAEGVVHVVAVVGFDQTVRG